LNGKAFPPAGPARMFPMRKALPAAAFAAFALLFLIVNRGAYQGFFQGDELDNIQWTRHLRPTDWLEGFLSPRYYPQNFRPVGHLYFNLMGRAAGLEFPWYVLASHGLHLLNLWLLWRLLGRLGFPPPAAAAGGLWFGFHMGVFDALWKPMYVFDLFCALFSLLCLLAYGRQSRLAWAGAFLSFWLALKSKEMAVMLPAALAVWEFGLGRRQWRRLLPLLAVSLAFGIQALLVNAGRDSEYTLHFAPAELWKSVAFYSSKVLLAPYAGLALLALPFLLRDRRAGFGLAFFLLLLTPMLLLTQRLFAAYLYLPLAGLAIAAAAAAARLHPALIAAFFVFWLPYNHAALRAQRREALSLAEENRRYLTRLAQAVRENPGAEAFIYDGVPAALHTWGIEAAVRYFAGRGDLRFYSAEERDLEKSLAEGAGVVLLSWDPVRRKLDAYARPPGAPDASYITVSRQAPVWQFGHGWYFFGGHFRWCRPQATARLRRPPGARAFELVVNMGPPPAGDPIRAAVWINGREIGAQSLARGSGWHTLRWPLEPAPPGPARVEIRAEPPFLADPVRPLGLAVGAFGFLPREEP
jgi:hypothetical protein